MSQIVKCDSAAGSTSRAIQVRTSVSHGKREMSTRARKGDAGNREAIVSMYQQLPEERKKQALDRLAASAHQVLGET